MNKKEYSKAYRQAHKDEAKEYREAHRDEIKAYRKAYNQAHKEEAKEYYKIHREHNEYMKAYQRQHYCCEDISKIENYSLAKKIILSTGIFITG